jgi:hypothetical protein
LECIVDSRKDEKNRRELLMHIKKVECIQRVLSAFPGWNWMTSQKDSSTEVVFINEIPRKTHGEKNGYMLDIVHKRDGT